MVDLPAYAWAVSLGGVFVGTTVQRLAGQGFGMVAAPLIGLVAPGMLPATLLVLGAVVGLSSVSVDLSALNRRELPWGMAGRALGAFVAAGIALALTDPGALALVIGALIWLGIALSVSGLTVPVTRASLFGAGVTAGVMGTLTAVGAPPMALLYQHHETRTAAAMQNAFFFWGMVVSIASLAVVGLVGWHHVAFAAALAPAAIAALVIAQPLAHRVARARIRPAALTLAGAAATALILKQLL